MVKICGTSSCDDYVKNNFCKLQDETTCKSTMGCGWTHATKQCEITDVSKFFTPLNDKDACANSKKYVEKINCTFTPRDALISQYVEVFTRAFDLLTKYKEDYKRLMELYAKRSPEIVNVQSKDALKKLLKQYPFIQAMIELLRLLSNYTKTQNIYLTTNISIPSSTTMIFFNTFI